ncbi:MAG: hypothetical protein ACW967_04350, partial [Candidatus Hodarchaeales archaeon]
MKNKKSFLLSTIILMMSVSFLQFAIEIQGPCQEGCGGGGGSSTITISGYITNSITGNGMSANVKLYDAQGIPLGPSTTSNSQTGYYSLQYSKSYSTYVVRATAAGYTTGSTSVSGRYSRSNVNIAITPDCSYITEPNIDIYFADQISQQSYEIMVEFDVVEDAYEDNPEYIVEAYLTDETGDYLFDSLVTTEKFAIIATQPNTVMEYLFKVYAQNEDGNCQSDFGVDTSEPFENIYIPGQQEWIEVDGDLKYEWLIRGVVDHTTNDEEIYLTSLSNLTSPYGEGFGILYSILVDVEYYQTDHYHIRVSSAWIAYPNSNGETNPYTVHHVNLKVQREDPNLQSSLVLVNEGEKSPGAQAT